MFKPVKFLILLLIIGVLMFSCFASSLATEQDLESLREAIEAKAEELTAQNPGQATLSDIQDVLNLAAEAQKIPGLDEVAEDLMDWAATALTLLAQSTLQQPFCAGTEEDVREALEIAALAQALPGVEKEVADNLIEWACICNWDIEITADYKDVSEGAVIESWGSWVKFQSIPLSTPLSKLFGQVVWPGIFPIYSESKGYLTHEKFAFYDGENWISGTRRGEPLWYLNVTLKSEEVEAGEEMKTLVLYSGIDRDSVYIKYGDEADSYLRFDIEREIPLEKLREGKPFSITYEYEYSEEYESLKERADLRFIPSENQNPYLGLSQTQKFNERDKR